MGGGGANLRVQEARGVAEGALPVYSKVDVLELSGSSQSEVIWLE